jgi:hypothetical protein
MMSITLPILYVILSRGAKNIAEITLLLRQSHFAFCIQKYVF